MPSTPVPSTGGLAAGAYAAYVNNPLNPVGGGRGVDPDEWTEGAEQRREERIKGRIAWVANGGLGVNLMTAAGAIILVIIVVSVLLRVFS